MTAADAAQEVRFASVFQGGAVLQRDVPVTVWGNASSGVSGVSVMLDGRIIATASVGGDRTWTAHLPPQRQASWASELRVVGHGSSGAGRVADVVPVRYGEVVLCSGQSNMQMPVNNWKPGGFSASNGTAEASAAGRYTGKISLMTLETPFPKPTMPPWNGTTCPPYMPADCVPQPQWNEVSPGPNGTLHGFSAVCWYTGKALFERLGGKVPVGLIVGSVGGSPIEFWLSPEALARCPSDTPPCDTANNKTDSGFYEQLIRPFEPYTLGSLVWDQGERDVHCFAPATNRTAEYPCLERELIRSWRASFNSTFAFAAVQLPGYIGDCDAIGANPNASYRNCVPGVFDMRVAQAAGVADDAMASAVATYDLSCPFGVASPQCPFGSVHNVNKTVICDRVAQQLMRMRGLLPHGAVTEGPRAIHAVAAQARVAGKYTVTVTFTGGTMPMYQQGTQYCAKCCAPASDGDFDVSADGGATFVNTTSRVLDSTGTAISVTAVLPAYPTHVRYTANQGFPQCALYNREGFPALPFQLRVEQQAH